MITPNGTCKGCDESIIWTRTKKGASMPVDPKPSKLGHFELAEDFGEITSTWRPNGPNLYICHFETCAARKKAKDEADEDDGMPF